MAMCPNWAWGRIWWNPVWAGFTMPFETADIYQRKFSSNLDYYFTISNTLNNLKSKQNHRPQFFHCNSSLKISKQRKSIHWNIQFEFFHINVLDIFFLKFNFHIHEFLIFFTTSDSSFKCSIFYQISFHFNSIAAQNIVHRTTNHNNTIATTFLRYFSFFPMKILLDLSYKHKQHSFHFLITLHASIHFATLIVIRFFSSDSSIFLVL